MSLNVVDAVILQSGFCFVSHIIVAISSNLCQIFGFRINVVAEQDKPNNMHISCAFSPCIYHQTSKKKFHTCSRAITSTSSQIYDKTYFKSVVMSFHQMFCSVFIQGPYAHKRFFLPSDDVILLHGLH